MKEDLIEKYNNIINKDIEGEHNSNRNIEAEIRKEKIKIIIIGIIIGITSAFVIKSAYNTYKDSSIDIEQDLDYSNNDLGNKMNTYEYEYTKRLMK